MNDKSMLHIRISQSMANEIENLTSTGLFSTKNEIIREAIRQVILKYKDEIKIKK